MWLNRPLGPWADELIRWCDGRCTINLVAHITTKNEHTIDVNMFKKAVFTLMYNEPHLRTDADLSVTPALWVPATDFSEAFHYEDLRDSGKRLDSNKSNLSRFQIHTHEYPLAYPHGGLRRNPFDLGFCLTGILRLFLLLVEILLMILNN